MMRALGSANRISFLPAASSSDPMEAAWRIDVDRHLFLGILGLEKQELRDDERRHAVIDWTGEKNNALLQHPRIDVVGPLPAGGLLDHGGDQVAQIGFARIFHLGSFGTKGRPRPVGFSGASRQ